MDEMKMRIGIPAEDGEDIVTERAACEECVGEFGEELSEEKFSEEEYDADLPVRIDPAELKNAEGLGVRRSLVDVFFASRGRSFTYYNDRFDVRVGDRVYVDGAMEGEEGTVVKVNTHFRIRVKDYKKILVCFRRELHGTFERLGNGMVSFDEDATDTDTFRSWVKAPAGEEDEIAVGDGYELQLHEPLNRSPDAEEKILQRGKVYAEDGHVVYLRRDGEQITAFVLGTKWYEIDCRYDEENDRICGLYCECPYNGLCKHALAAVTVLKETMDRIGDAEKARHFTAIDRRSFWEIAAESVERVRM